MKISSCIIIKQNGVHSIRSITKLNAHMPIITKTLEEILLYSSMIVSILAQIGDLQHLLLNTTKDVAKWATVNIAMAGKKKNIILCSIKQYFVQILIIIKSAQEDLNVHSIMIIKIKEFKLNTQNTNKIDQILSTKIFLKHLFN